MLHWLELFQSFVASDTAALNWLQDCLAASTSYSSSAKAGLPDEKIIAVDIFIPVGVAIGSARAGGDAKPGLPDQEVIPVDPAIRVEVCRLWISFCGPNIDPFTKDARKRSASLIELWYAAGADASGATERTKR